MTEPTRRFAWFGTHVEHANDGIVATAGIVEGFAGAGAALQVLFVAGVAGAIAGAIAIGGNEFSVVANEREQHLARIAEEERQLALDPAAELAELTQIYRDKGLEPELAATVAAELSAKDALAAHADAELGLAVADDPGLPWIVGLRTAAAFIIGSVIPLAFMLTVNPELRTEVTLIAVLGALAVAAFVASRIQGVDPRKPIFRSLVIGALAMGVTYLAGLALRF